jgi:tetratricopeptide (TPR) repeat protein
MMGKFAVSQPLVEHAMYSMISAFGEDSVQVAECEYELADVLLDSGKAEEAEKTALKAYAIRQVNYEADSGVVIDSVQQLAIIYDNMGYSEKAFAYYQLLLNYLKSLEDESVFDDTVKILRNILVLFFRTIATSQRRLVNQLRLKEMDRDSLRDVFQKMIEGDPIDMSKRLLKEYEECGEESAFDALACIYHIGLNEISHLSWLDEH